jgi:thiol-disulfide isomerase/thioredoxin
MRHSRVFLTALFLVIQAFQLRAQQPRKLPPFSFFRLDSRPFNQQNIQKDRTSVFILFDSGCDHCQKEIPSIGKQYTQLVNCTFYFVSFNETKQISDFMKTYGKDFYEKKNVVVLRDSNRQFLPTFFPEKFPAVFMYTPKGDLSYYRSGNQDVNSMVRAARAAVQ